VYNCDDQSINLFVSPRFKYMIFGIFICISATYSTVINCPSLTVGLRLPLRMSSCGNYFGAKCNFSCTIGYRLNGSSTVRCVAPGNRPPGSWDNPLPTCQGR